MKTYTETIHDLGLETLAKVKAGSTTYWTWMTPKFKVVGDIYGVRSREVEKAVERTYSRLAIREYLAAQDNGA